MGRSLHQVIETVTLAERGIGVKSLIEQIDTTSSGDLVLSHFGALAELERGLIREWTNAGLAAARARCRRCDRPKALADAAKLAAA